MRAACARTAVAAGYFDPLLAQHAARLAEIRARCETLIAVVLDPASPILEARARAELVAALDSVSYVVTGGATLAHGSFFDETDTHRTAFDRLVEHVRERHRTAVAV